MTARARILLVSPPDGVSSNLASFFLDAGHETVVASDFVSARNVLADRPDLLITDLKLGAYNGLHLAIRAAGCGTPVVIIGDPDPVLQADAERFQATYLTSPVDLQRLLTTVTSLLESSRPTRRSSRKRVPNLEAFVNDVQARLIDVSSDGMRIETPMREHAALPRYFVVRLPQFRLACRVQRIWTSAVVAETEPPVVWCGAAVSDDLEASSAWRILIDTIPAEDGAR